MQRKLSGWRREKSERGGDTQYCRRVRGWTDERLLTGDSDLEVSRADGTDKTGAGSGTETNEGGRKGREKEGRKKRKRWRRMECQDPAWQ